MLTVPQRLVDTARHGSLEGPERREWKRQRPQVLVPAVLVVELARQPLLVVGEGRLHEAAHLRGGFHTCEGAAVQRVRPAVDEAQLHLTAVDQLVRQKTGVQPHLSPMSAAVVGVRAFRIGTGALVLFHQDSRSGQVTAIDAPGDGDLEPGQDRGLAHRPLAHVGVGPVALQLTLRGDTFLRACAAIETGVQIAAAVHELGQRADRELQHADLNFSTRAGNDSASSVASHTRWAG